MSKIYVKLQGGMCNQAFQYSLGRKLQLKYNIPLYLDLSFLNRRDLGSNFVYRNYDLDVFNINPIFDTPTQVNHLINEPSLLYNDYISNIYNHIPKSDSIYIDGYWQCDRYFKEFESDIRKEFTFKDAISTGKELDLLNDICNSNSVMINIRRTDYLNTDFHGVFGIDYINKAIRYINQMVESPKFFIFSDDIKWCQDNLNDIDNSLIVDHTYAGPKFGTYMQLMTKCKHFIIPNSSFAWWSAWLAANDDKIVIAPKNWYAKDVPNDIIYDDMNWIRI